MGRRKIERTEAEVAEIKKARNEKRKEQRRNRSTEKKNCIVTQQTAPIIITSNSVCIPNRTNVSLINKLSTPEHYNKFINYTFKNKVNDLLATPSTSRDIIPLTSNQFPSQQSEQTNSTSLSPRLIDFQNWSSEHNFNRSSPVLFTESQNFLSEHDYSTLSQPTFTELQNHHSEHNYYKKTINQSSNNVNFTNEHLIQNESNVNNIIGIDRIQQNYLGEMNVSCQHCNAKHFSAEKVSNKANSFNECCRHGEVALESQPEFPILLKSLFEGTHEKSNNFFNRIRNFNSSFSFASFNANLVDLSSQRRGPYCFKIQGQIYYQINTSLYPSSNESPSYGQLFIVDTTEAVECRSKRNVDCDVNLLKDIDIILRQHNIFAKSYQMMKDVLKNSSVIDENGGIVEPELNLIFTLKPGMDVRRYNFQRVNEVAAVFSTTVDGEIPESYVTVQNKNTKTFQYLSTMDPNTEPWVYPLFYPTGNQGWHESIPYVHKTNRRVTRADYYKFHLATRDEFNVFLMGRRLTQQWIVDSYVKIEKDRLNYCKFNQKKLRAESYQGLLDHLHSRNNNSDTNSNIGRIVILPSSFPGSARNMLQHYQDAMSIVRIFRKPDLFVTMTCNPKWREISDNLLPGQSASDRPDLVARVFDLKKNALIKMIVKDNLFGEVVAYNWVIEFQKRALPHLHMLITLKSNCKIVTPDRVDEIISAEIPNQTNNPILYDIVSRNMLHGPCGDWCLINGVCSKKFPKNFRDVTTMDENGYPFYRRRDNGTTFTRNDYVFDNRHVVPYNATLLVTFNCHINVEVVSSIKAVKYLYKYVYKGHDKAGITINGRIPNDQPALSITENRTSNDSNINTIDHDEVRNFVDARYVGPVEAAWRILSKNLQNKSHSIIRLPVHLPNQHSVTINDDCNHNELQEALQKQTMLIDYFSLNERDTSARQYIYSDIPRHYVFKKNNETKISSWQPRKRNFNVIGRMYSVSPSQIDLFHLRLLLIHIKGAKSFEELKTVNGIICDTFMSACLAAGLIEDDQEWRRTLNEAVSWMMPRQLRCLFARILIHCQPLNPEKLWEEFKLAMSEDVSRRLGLEEGQKRAYVYINSILQREGHSLSVYPGMPQINDIEISNFIINAIECNTCDIPNCVYIDGPGGSGKTFVYTTLCQILKNKNKNVCTMAYTGIAATLLPNGKTVHKTFGLPVPMFSDSSSHIKPNSVQGEYLKNVDVFVWDEAPMSPRHALEIIDRTLRHIMNNDIPFGGKMMILGGDFRQLLPVQPNATRTETVNMSIKYSALWIHFQKFSLTQNMRALPEEIEFVQFLLNVGDGSLNNLNDELNLPDMCSTSKNNDIVDNVYGNIIRGKRYTELTKTVILSARNVDVDAINREVVALLDSSTEKIYAAVDSTENCDNGNMDDAILPEYLNTLNPPNFPPYELHLRQYAIVMLIRNINLSEGLCNGTRLIVEDLGVFVLRCKILTGDKAGDIVFINRMTLYCENIYPFTFKRRQFPIKVAFCMTINKAQGQTFDKVGIDLTKDVFNHGQF
ncbi:uncharacterized protein LOC130676918 [Microplitis mediator]|uniref:uncharacterized protein LOC130676918 n=1 Tax=Microplitis mediator TaxID=375433 RepID=UPI0025522F6D|nr:uncharacterized protein LOC130676918 [Microplitis mediator]